MRQKKAGWRTTKAKSSKKFAMSGAKIPNKKTLYYAIIKASKLNVRTWAGEDHDTVSFSPLEKGDIIEVCDAILEDKESWYYIQYNGLYGFVNGKYIEKVPDEAVKVLSLLKKYSSFVKAHSNYMYREYMPDLDTYDKAKARVYAKKKVGLTCVVPLRWALKDMGIKRKDGKSLISGDDGSFDKCYNGGVKNHLRRILHEKPVGMTVKEAVTKGLLKPGDILCYRKHTHTSTYSGKGCWMYEGGGASFRQGYEHGIKVDRKNYDRKIAEVLRWR